MSGRQNMAAGFISGRFLLYGFILIYLRDFAPGKEAWIAEYAVGKHLESRLAHVYGNLFAFINIVTGYLLVKLPINPASAKVIAWLVLTGMLMPIGILAEVLFGLPPVLAIIGGVSMTLAMVWFGLALLRMKTVVPGR